MSKLTLPNGADALLSELSLSTIMVLIERTARWVDPATHNFLPIWYPEHARRGLFYKSNWSEPQLNKNRQTGISIHKHEANIHANKALTYALGLRSNDREGWSCCHIWGVDDPTYQTSNLVVQDNRYFSAVANMVLLPTPLKTFTDTMPEVKAMIRICATHLYKWQCNHPMMKEINAELDELQDWENYPKSWPNSSRGKLPIGIMKINPDIQQSAHRRWSKIQNDLKNAGEYYPKNKVMDALEYWGLDPNKTLDLQ